MRLSRRQLNEWAADQELGARKADEGAADARRALADPDLAPHARQVTRAALAVHTQNAREMRENAAALRDGVQPDDL